MSNCKWRNGASPIGRRCGVEVLNAYNWGITNRRSPALHNKCSLELLSDCRRGVFTARFSWNQRKTRGETPRLQSDRSRSDLLCKAAIGDPSPKPPKALQCLVALQLEIVLRRRAVIPRAGNRAVIRADVFQFPIG